MSDRQKIVHIICGPTASGKSARASAIANAENGVVINADSLQLYNRLPILTAQPDMADMRYVPHRLYGVLDCGFQCTAGAWAALALQEIHAALEKVQTPIVVGGTGFYIKVLIEGLSPIPEIPDDVRVMAQDLVDRLGSKEFHASLGEKDPVMAARLHPNDRQRVVRAWEVLMHTGISLSQWQDRARLSPPDDLVFDVEVILPERDILYDRCNRRFHHMIDSGVVSEVAALDEDIFAGRIAPDAPVTNALGFSPLQQHVRGEIDLETAIFLAQNETRHYAKRQTTWFRNQIKNNDPPQKNIAKITFAQAYSTLCDPKP